MLTISPVNQHGQHTFVSGKIYGIQHANGVRMVCELVIHPATKRMSLSGQSVQEGENPHKGTQRCYLPIDNFRDQQWRIINSKVGSLYGRS